MLPDRPCVRTYVQFSGIYTPFQELLIEAKSPEIVKAKEKNCFTLHVFNNALRDIVEGDIWYCNQPNLLLLGTNKIGTVLGTRVNGSSEKACPLILCVEGQWFCWIHRWRWSCQFGWMRVPYSIPMYVRCTGIVVVNAARQTVCTYVRSILGDLHTLSGTLDRS